MIFSPYKTKIDIIEKCKDLPIFNKFQVRVDIIKKLETTRIKAYLTLGGVDDGRGPFLVLPRNLTLDKMHLKAYKKTILKYTNKYKHDFLKNKLYLEIKPSKDELLQNLADFKREIKSIDKWLFEALQSEFKRLKFWFIFYKKSQKCAWWAYRAVNFPRIFIRETKRILAQISKFWHKF